MNRRNFIQGLAVFGSIMALPERLRSQPLPPAQNLIVLPPDALTTNVQSFIWIDRMPLTGAYRFELRLAQKLDPLFRVNDSFGSAVDLLPSRLDLQFELTTTSQDLSRLLRHAIGGVENEIIFMAPKDNYAQIVRAYIAGMTNGFDSDSADVVQVSWRAIKEPQQIAAAELPNYLRQPYKAA